MSAELRGLRPDERDAVLDLWGEVFGGDSRDYFLHYFTADPDYRDDDCRVAVVDGRLAAAVHVCRRRMEWQGREIVCGAIANVATRKEDRRQGLSRDLLGQAVSRMDEEQFAFSMLFTGRISHYAPLGWEPVTTPRLLVRLAQSLPPVEQIRLLEPQPLPPVVPHLYDTVPHRPLHMVRPEGYFAGWAGWLWRMDPDTKFVVHGEEGRESGYAVFNSGSEGDPPCVHEMRASDRGSEQALLVAAAHRASALGAEALELAFLPQCGGAQVAAALGEVIGEQSSSMMLRRGSISSQEMEQIVGAYRSGEAKFWRGDDF